MNHRLCLTITLLATPAAASVAMAAPGGFGGGHGFGNPSTASPGGYFYTGPYLGPSSPRPAPDDPLSLQYRERFLAASGNNNRLTFSEAMSAHLVDGRRTFAGIDRRHRGVITLEDVRRFVRDGDGQMARAVLSPGA